MDREAKKVRMGELENRTNRLHPLGRKFYLIESAASHRRFAVVPKVQKNKKRRWLAALHRESQAGHVVILENRKGFWHRALYPLDILAAAPVGDGRELAGRLRVGPEPRRAGGGVWLCVAARVGPRPDGAAIRHRHARYHPLPHWRRRTVGGDGREAAA